MDSISLILHFIILQCSKDKLTLVNCVRFFYSHNNSIFTSTVQHTKVILDTPSTTELSTYTFDNSGRLSGHLKSILFQNEKHFYPRLFKNFL